MNPISRWRARRRLAREVQETYEAAVVEWLGALQDWRENDYCGGEVPVVITFDSDHDLTEEEVHEIRQRFIDLYAKYDEGNAL